MTIAEHALRAGSYFTNRLRAIEKSFLTSGSPEAALAALATERLQINHLQRWAAEHAAEDGRTARLCIEFLSAGPHVLDVTMSPRDRMRWAVDGLRAARALTDEGAEMRVLGRLGLAFNDQNKSLWASRVFERQRVLADRLGDRSIEAEAIGNLGVALKRLKRHRAAVRCYTEQFRICEEIKFLTGQGRALGNLAVALRHLGHIEWARKSLLRRAAIAVETMDERGLANACLNLGLVEMDAGSTDECMRCLSEARSRFHRIGDLRGVARTLGSIGKLLLSSGNIDDGMRYAVRAHRMFVKLQFRTEQKEAEELLKQYSEGRSGFLSPP